MHSYPVIITHGEHIDAGIFKEFLLDMESRRLKVKVEALPPPGAYMSVEWLVPTAIVVYLAQKYFEGFLGEMGKDHYAALKNALAKLTHETVNMPRIEPFMMSAAGKVKTQSPYSMAFSLLAEGRDGLTFKLLVPKASTRADYDRILSLFLTFVADYHTAGSETQAALEIERSGMRWGTITVAYNDVTNAIEWQDPVPPDVRERIR